MMHSYTTNETNATSVEKVLILVLMDDALVLKATAMSAVGHPS